jgi:hypothetical protein
MPEESAKRFLKGSRSAPAKPAAATARPGRVLAGTVAVVVAVLALFALLHRTSLAFTLGVAGVRWAAVLPPGQEACQTPVDVPAAFDRITLPIGTFRRPGSALVVTVRGPGNGVIAQGRLPAGYPDIAQRPLETIRLNRSVGASSVAVCLRNAGGSRVALYGNSALAARGTSVIAGGRDVHTDMSLVFERPPRSLASQAGAIAQRAALFRYGGMSPWLYLVLAAGLLVAGPLALVRALRTALTWAPDDG